ncbi:hypothetical protein WOLCODRAFT_16158 [Wolfiporia cocos MD-104 SS10]|uniref:AB hydrolase-1 domain-containing protein n=1 Tax=Wolfiporia cocos (strain MD-104) TaxID=742152 RepID=A0A2H3JC74_WOLCO|nr:hypothetical protein WOLCODRAFT_16158 [Wolfiporia cocos MD-104 SS10]
MPISMTSIKYSAIGAWIVAGALRLIAPGSALFCIASWLAGRPPVSSWLGTYALAEVLFFILVYLPRSQYLQQSSSASTGWFYADSPSETIQQDNLKDLLLWAIFNTEAKAMREEWREEIDDYVMQIEIIIGQKLRPGRNENVRCKTFTLDTVKICHKPLIFYLQGFKHYRTRAWDICFPPRFDTAFSRRSVHPLLGYWYRPHRSRTKNPILFLHGVGIGLYPYLPFLVDIVTADPDVGIISIEDLPISTHITHAHLRREEMLKALTQILDHHEFQRITVVGHSYGTVIASHMVHDSTLSSRIASTVLVDPIAILPFLPDLTANFVYGSPGAWMPYFVCRDPGIAHTVQRSLFFIECALWREDLRRAGVVLAERDELIAAEEIWGYLTGRASPEHECQQGKLEILFFEKLGHGDTFNSQAARKEMAMMVMRMSMPQDASDTKVSS